MGGENTKGFQFKKVYSLQLNANSRGWIRKSPIVIASKRQILNNE
jgi:hypothetical protein